MLGGGRISPMFRRGGEVIDPDALLYFDEAGSALTSTFRSAINWGFTDLKATGNYSKISFMFWGGGPDQILSTANFVNPAHKLTEEITSGWESGLWWQGDGARYLDLLWNPVDDGGGVVSQNNLGITLLTMQGGLYEAKTVFGAADTGSDITVVQFNTNKTLWYVNSAASVEGTITRTSGINTGYRVDGTNISMYYEGLANGTSAAASAAAAQYDWYALGGNSGGSLVSPSTNKLTCIIGHSGDADVSALHETINGIIARLNGGYITTPLNLAISGMNPMDSCFYGNLTGSLMVVCGGYDPLDVDQASNNVWTTPDGVTFTQRTDMPFKLAHALGGVRNDGYLWLWATTQTGDLVCIKMNPADYSWTTVNADLGGVGEDLEGFVFCQWGFTIGDVMYAAVYNSVDTSDVQIWSSVDGDSWTYVSDFPADGHAINCGWYVDGTTVRVAGGCLVSGANTSDYVENIYESTDLCQTWQLVRSLPASLQSAWPVFFKFNGQEFYSPGRKTTATIYEGGVYRWTGSEWLNTLMSNLSGRHAVATTQFNNEQYFINGFLYNDCHKLTTI